MVVIIKLTQIELVWVKVRVEKECFWVNLREDNKVFESKMAVYDSNMAEFKMAAIIKLSQNEWVRLFLQKLGTDLGKCGWVWKEKLRWLNPRWCNWSWQNSIWLPSSRWVRMNEWSFSCKMAESNMAEFNMAAIIKLSQNEWVKFFCGKWLNPRWLLPSSSWVRMNDFESDWNSCSQSFEQNGWIHYGIIQDVRMQDGCHHQVESEWMSDFFCAKWLKPWWQSSIWLP